MPADKASLALIENFDGFAGLRNALRDIAVERGDWAGIPMPLANERLVIEPSYPKAAELMAMGGEPDGVEAAPEPGWSEADIKVRNRFFSWRWRCEIVVYERQGKIEWARVGRPNHAGAMLGTLGCADAWGIEQEARAVNLLGTLVRHRQFKQYMLTGLLLETSKRSGVSYIFRRLRPTLAMRPNKDGSEMRMLCALCLHPIAYYAGTWGGAMCPTDDVIAHLSLMRGDEPMFWRRANQHPPFSHLAGVS